MMLTRAQKTAVTILLFAACTVLIHCAPQQVVVEIPPHPTTRVDDVHEVLHDVPVADPYRWLEDQEGPETRLWIDEQNAYTDAIMIQVPGREIVRQTIADLMQIDTITTPFERSGRLFYSRRAADQDLSVQYWRDGVDGEEHLLIDPHTMSDDHSVNVNLVGVTPDGQLVLYGVRQGGKDEIAVKMMSVETGEHLTDELEESLYYGVAMKPDKSGYYYVRRSPEGSRMYYREMGSRPEDETLVFGENLSPRYFMTAYVTDDGQWLITIVNYGFSRTGVFIKDLLANDEFKTVVDGPDASFFPIYVDGRLYILTDHQAPNRRLLLADTKRPSIENWVEVIPERENAVLQQISPAGGRLFARYLENVRSQVQEFDADGNRLGEVRFDDIGTLSGMSGDWESDVAFFSFSSFHIPPTIYKYTVSTGDHEVWERIDVPFDGSRYTTEQLRFRSKDETEVPMFVVHAKGMALDGNQPTLLTGYGGFNVSLTPAFSTRTASWLELGGVYAVANLRGGGELGEDWHQAGTLEKKQSVFDDFIAAAEFLIAEGYTRPEKLAIRGGSNGGLLVATVANQRPELFGAVLSSYAVLDMLRFHKFLVGEAWTTEYGHPDDPEHFKFLHAYSPYHNVKEGGHYPATYFAVGDGDTRVAPLHTRKMLARLQAANASERPIVMRYQTTAGHVGGLPVSERIDDSTEQMLFLLWQLDALPR
jgi:prolyl oligopeptidase